MTASASPVIVGSALASAMGYELSWLLFALALVSIMALHTAANLANDFFDHLSGNDPANTNPTPFSGGSRAIQEKGIAPAHVLAVAAATLAIGVAGGLAIVAITRSLFILAIGIFGTAVGLAYTAPPVKLAYRTAGEVSIALVFGILPTIGAFYMHSSQFRTLVLIPATLIGILIFLIILINEFPDFEADAAVNKRTLPVTLGKVTSARIYRAMLVSSYPISAVMLLFDATFYAAVAYFLTIPIAAIAIGSFMPLEKFAPGNYAPQKLTIILHAAATALLAAAMAFAGG